MVEGKVFKISFNGSRGAGPIAVPGFEADDIVIHVRHNGTPITFSGVFAVDADTGVVEQTRDTDLSEHNFDLIVFRQAPVDEPAAVEPGAEPEKANDDPPPPPDDPPPPDEVKKKSAKGDST